MHAIAIDYRAEHAVQQDHEHRAAAVARACPTLPAPLSEEEAWARAAAARNGFAAAEAALPVMPE